MDSVTPDAILRQRGKWITSSDFVDKVSKRREVKPRQAKNLIADAYDNKQVIRHVFSDRTVIYGLPEFGPPILEKPPKNEEQPSRFELASEMAEPHDCFYLARFKEALKILHR